MLTIQQIDPHSDQAIALIKLLDADLNGLYEAQATYAGHNLLAADVTFYCAMLAGEAVACGGFRPMSDPEAVEVKRMYVAPHVRQQGIGRKILEQIERDAARLGYRFARLETGTKQLAAIQLYQKAGFRPIPCYPPYTDMPESICYEKALA